jgi:hypothetical protein
MEILSEKKIQEQLYKALDHGIRRDILRRIGENSVTYTELLQELGIESGHLAYHIRNMEELLEKDAEGLYSLTRSGKRAYNFLMEEPVSKQSRDNPLTFVSLVAIVFLTLVLALGVFINVTNQEKMDQKRLDQLRFETTSNIDATLTTIYQIFEHYEISRESWMDLFLKTIKIRGNLEKINESMDDEKLNSIISQLEEYESEMFHVLRNNDEKYLELTVEKRYIVRELQTLLMRIELILS